MGGIPTSADLTRGEFCCCPGGERCLKEVRGEVLLTNGD